MSVRTGSSSRSSGSSKTRRYRTRGLTSYVDESLFGTAQIASQNTKQSEPRVHSSTQSTVFLPPIRGAEAAESAERSKHPFPQQLRQAERYNASNGSSNGSSQPRTQAMEKSHSTPAQKSQPGDTIRIITKDFIRDLKVPSKDPSGLSVILSPVEIERLTSASRVPTKEEREAKMEALQKRKEAVLEAAEQRKDQFHQIDISRKKNQALSELDAEARERAQYLLERANAMRMEKEEEIKRVNELIMGAQCHATRDSQILERRQIQKELMEEERRLDAMMELERRRAIETQEQIDERRKQQRIRGKELIIEQIEKRLEEKLLEDELKEQEGQQLLQNLERMKQEELEALERRREEQDLLQQDIMRINAQTLQEKEEKKEEERLADVKAMDYIRKKMEREAEYEAEQKRLKREKELEVTRLRALQEKDRDYKAEQDELRARRNQEAAEREWRRKEKEQAEKKTQEEAKLKAGRLEQVTHKEHFLSIEAGRERAEFDRVQKAQQEAIAKQKEEEEKQRQTALHHADGIRQQVRERQLLAVAQRREILREKDQRAEEARQRRLRLGEIKEKKLKELKDAGLPEKYCNEVERKVQALNSLVP